MKGFTLIEVIVVIALISTLSLLGSIQLTSLQSTAMLNSATEELASEIRTARNMSITGKIEEGKTMTDYKDLPVYKLSLSTNQYSLVREYTKQDGTVVSQQIETKKLDQSMTLGGDTEISFNRLTGTTSPRTFTISKDGSSEKKQISVNSEGIIQITNL